MVDWSQDPSDGIKRIARDSHNAAIEAAAKLVESGFKDGCVVDHRPHVVAAAIRALLQ